MDRKELAKEIREVIKDQPSMFSVILKTLADKLDPPLMVCKPHRGRNHPKHDWCNPAEFDIYAAKGLRSCIRCGNFQINIKDQNGESVWVNAGLRWSDE